jgi:purine-binding chemotaxis protein CheW
MLQSEFTEELEDTQHGRFLTFYLEEEIFGIEIKYVIEIVNMQPITKLPQQDSCMKGVINLRGKIIPVTDMRIKFGKEAAAYHDRTCIIIIEIQDLLAGWIVDKVADVISLDDASIEPAPDYSLDIKSKYIRGIGKVRNEVKLLVDCEKLYSFKDVRPVNGAALNS